MAAFPQLGYGFKSNTSHVIKKEPVITEALTWWRQLTNDRKAELIVKENPNSLRESRMRKEFLWTGYDKNPQVLFDKYHEEYVRC